MHPTFNWFLFWSLFSLGIIAFNALVFRSSKHATDHKSTGVYKYSMLVQSWMWLFFAVSVTSPYWFLFILTHRIGANCSAHACELPLSEHAKVFGMWLFWIVTIGSFVLATLVSLYKVTLTDDSILIQTPWATKIQYSRVDKVYFRCGLRGSRVLVVEHGLGKEITISGGLGGVEQLANLICERCGIQMSKEIVFR